MNPSKSQAKEDRLIVYGQIQKKLIENKEKADRTVNEVVYRFLQEGKGIEENEFSFDAEMASFQEVIEHTCYRESMMKKLFVPKKERKNVKDSVLIPNSMVCFCSRLFNYDCVPMNKHACFDLYYVWKGDCRIEFEHDAFSIKEGMVCIVSPKSDHRALPKEESDVFLLSIRTSTFENTFFSYLTTQNLLTDFFRHALYDKSPQPNYLLFMRKNRKIIQTIIEELYRETNFPSEWNEESLFHYLCLLFMTILKNFSFDDCFSPIMDPKDELATVLLDHISKNYQSDSLKELAKKLHYNPNYLSGLIREKTGMNFTQLVRNFRIEDAKRLLSTTSLSIEEIAERCGYVSPDSFSKVFKKETGANPSKFRKNLKEGMK